MKKLGFILGATCAMVVAAGGLTASHLNKLPERDAMIIVEVNRSLESLNKQGVKNTQDVVFRNIKQYATTNVRLTQRFNELNNAFVMKVNSNDIESIKNVPGVKSVTVDKGHCERVYNNDDYIPLTDPEQDENPVVLNDSDNISAITMNKPDDSYDGEGTLIAILDNEFHLKGKDGSNPEWHHEVFDELPDDVAVRYTFNSIKTVLSNGMNASARKFGAKAGQEGSLFLNSKVPFYFDYGGKTTVYGKIGEKQYDVHSEIDYHGSHVSSITAANAPAYKGIAPKAQLALMKVFTDYDAKEGIGKKIGLSNSSRFHDVAMLSALEDCIKLGVDGINVSIGSDLDDFENDSITMKTLRKLSKAGILSSISAGNSGKSSWSSSGAYANWGTDMVETGIMGSFANNASTMTIASGHPVQVFYENAFHVGNKNIAFEDQIINREGLSDDFDVEYRMKDLVANDPTAPLEWVYVPGFGTSGDYNNIDVEGKIAVVNRGSTSFADKYAIAEDKGAKALVIINNDPTASYFNFRCSFGDGFNPSMPCALVLYKDKAFFEEQRTGQFTLISKQASDNPYKYTVSDFSTDGATFDLDLKPEITAPGDNIKGAVPEHAMTNLTKEERESEEYKYKCYQYLSGTSMAAPNYAGAQALVLSKVAGPAYISAKNNGSTTISDTDKDAIAAYKSTVDMRLMSTARQLKDRFENPETNVVTTTSPRIQGAGMVDLTGALNTPVYLEGFELAKNEESGEMEQVRLGKSKINLRNNPDIANGDIKLQFIAHNDSQQEKNYDVKLTVMRPALAHPNNFVTKDYNYLGEIDSVESLPGMSYYDIEIEGMSTSAVSSSYKDACKISKDIEYYASEADYNAQRKSTIKAGYYYNDATSGINWAPLPSYTAMSTMDVVIAEVTGQTVTVSADEETLITIDDFSLSEEQKAEILENFNYGCMIEGYVTLESKDGDPDLSIPYLGFYSGSDKDEEASYDSAPVSEPFNFEKDITKVYPSDLVNDITKSMLGKDKVNFESMILAGYAEQPQKIDVDKILTNDQSFDKLTGFYKAGTDPKTGEYTDNPSNDIYVGNPKYTNTMIIQQFMLRSVAENYFSITNKETGEVVYKSVLQDMLFGQTAGKWALHKSHVSSNYLSGGYVACRAYAIVPLYDVVTGEAFESGEYELKFNYQLAASGNWVDKSYNIHIDSDIPVLKTACQYIDDNGDERVRFYFDEERLAYGTIGYYLVDAHYDQERGMYYFDETREFVENAAKEISGNREVKRTFVGAIDYARGSSGCIIHVNDYKDLNKGFTTVQGANVALGYDFTYEDGQLTFINNKGRVVQVPGIIYINGFAADTDVDNPANVSNKNNSALSFGLVIAISTIIILAGAAVITASSLSKKKKGGR